MPAVAGGGADPGVRSPTVARMFDAVASGYDRCFAHVTRLFIPALLDAAQICPGHRVLDVATGTGLAAEAAARRVGPSGVVLAVDLSLSMLGQARERGIAWTRLVAMDGQALACRDASFDAVLCQLGLMFFVDVARGLAEFRRVLRPGGWAAVCVTSTPERTVYGRVGRVIERHLPARWEALERFFSLADPGRLAGLLEGAGFREVSVSGETREVGFGSFDEYWQPMEEGFSVVGSAYWVLPEEARRAVHEEVRRELAVRPDGRVVIEMETLFGVGRR